MIADKGRRPAVHEAKRRRTKRSEAERKLQRIKQIVLEMQREAFFASERIVLQRISDVLMG